MGFAQGADVKAPQVKLLWVMAFVAAVAINLSVIRGMHIRASLFQTFIGTIPTTVVLLLVYLRFRRRPHVRPYLIGFLLFGLAAQNFSVLMTLQHEHAIFHYYLEPLLLPVRDLFGDPINGHIGRKIGMFVGGMLVVVPALALPQIVFAHFGGILTYLYQSTRRSRRGKMVSVHFSESSPRP